MSKLSVILTSRDRYPFIKYAVDSVLQQTYEDWELIIVDDDSQSLEVQQYLRLVEHLPKVQVVRGGHRSEQYRQEHKMVSVMVNMGLDVANGEYITYLCDDDSFVLDRFERLMAEIEEHNLDMVVDKVEWILSDGTRNPQDFVRFNYQKPFEEGHDRLLAALGSSNFICHDCVVHRATKRRWPTNNTHTPVDWRFWVAMTNDAISIKVLNEVGAEAFFPGLWREGMTLTKAMQAKFDKPQALPKVPKENTEMRKVKYAKNVSGKRQIISRAGNQIRVEKDDVIELEKVMLVRDGVPMLYPGFVYHDENEVPEVDNPTMVEENMKADLQELKKKMEPNQTAIPAPKVDFTVVDFKKEAKVPYKEEEFGGVIEGGNDDGDDTSGHIRECGSSGDQN